MERTEKGYRLSTGREFRANQGLISIARNDDPLTIAEEFRIAEGYDGTILVNRSGDEWTPAERTELAEFMIAQWTAFLDSVRLDLCREERHDFGPFTYGTKRGRYFKVMICQRCGEGEEVEVTREEYEAS